MTTFVFDIDKTVAAAAYLAQKSGGRVSVFVLLKMMYDAERTALFEWHRPITGDSFASLPKGIILSRTYNLIKNEIMSTESDMVKWSQHFSQRESDHTIRLIAEPDYDFLSVREREALDKGFNEITNLMNKHGKIADVLHELWPEWKDPEKTCGKRSMPLDLKDILSELIEDEKEVERICLEVESVQSAKAALQTN
jgi:Antitoxin SocA-like, Panacea domain